VGTACPRIQIQPARLKVGWRVTLSGPRRVMPAPIYENHSHHRHHTRTWPCANGRIHKARSCRYWLRTLGDRNRAVAKTIPTAERLCCRGRFRRPTSRRVGETRFAITRRSRFVAQQRRTHKPQPPLWQVPAAEFSAMIDVNIKGVANVIRHFVPAMVARRIGIIANFSSGWGR
jgi:hypothetical protein